ncbi:hypothetical protein NHH03_16165 [Stieleria sp. TO1_6]|uniref:hypothetical protein n=1 Tax=Stieleria tagensis TaxID=2956795 RepID=UPI00209BB7A5|nr:hypothetical protein [Stieleria tagensis]MCO8123285.1 hypothetical protein [Stieleria tagensis]
MAANLHGAATEGAELVGTSVDAEPAVIVEAINSFLAKPKKAGWFAKVDNWDDRALPIGSLWGHAIARKFGWQWASLTQHDHDDFKAIAIVNDDRSLAVFPFHYCFGCLENHVPPTVLLAYNMLDAAKIPQQPPGGYMNLMDGVHHIIPPA